jgi:alpha-amylase
VRLTNDKLICLLTPAQGGHLYELDVRSICHNLLATMARRPEAYHRKVMAGANPQNNNVASIHDRVVFKQAGLDQRLHYDRLPRHGLVDRFLDDAATLEEAVRSELRDHGDFALGVYEAKIRRGPSRVQAELVRDGLAFGLPVRVTKIVTLQAGSGTLEIAYRLEGLPAERALHFAVELNFSGLPSGVDDRYFYRLDEPRLGQLGTRLNLQHVQDLGLVDQWLGINVRWSADRPTQVWTYPVETVSQSEGGFELVHQSVVVMPRWFVHADADGRWDVTMNLNIDTSLAESRMEECAAAAVGS